MQCISQDSSASELEEANGKIAAALGQLAQSENVFIRRDATRALGPWGNKKSVEVLTVLVNHGDIFTQREAIKALTYYPSKAAAQTIATRVGEFQVTASVNESFKVMEKYVEAALTPLLDSDQEAIRNHCYELLAVYGTKKSLEKLESLIDEQKPDVFQRSLFNAIEKIKMRG